MCCAECYSKCHRCLRCVPYSQRKYSSLLSCIYKQQQQQHCTCEVQYSRGTESPIISLHMFEEVEVSQLNAKQDL